MAFSFYAFCDLRRDRARLHYIVCCATCAEETRQVCDSFLDRTAFLKGDRVVLFQGVKHGGFKERAYAEYESLIHSRYELKKELGRLPPGQTPNDAKQILSTLNMEKKNAGK